MDPNQNMEYQRIFGSPLISSEKVLPVKFMEV